MSNETENSNLNYLIFKLLMGIDYLFYHLKMKQTELLFQSIMYQKLK